MLWLGLAGCANTVCCHIFGTANLARRIIARLDRIVFSQLGLLILAISMRATEKVSFTDWSRVVALCAAAPISAIRLDYEGQSLFQANEIKFDVTQLIGCIICPLLVQRKKALPDSVFVLPSPRGTNRIRARHGACAESCLWLSREVDCAVSPCRNKLLLRIQHSVPEGKFPRYAALCFSQAYRSLRDNSVSGPEALSLRYATLSNANRRHGARELDDLLAGLQIVGDSVLVQDIFERLFASSACRRARLTSRAYNCRDVSE